MTKRNYGSGSKRERRPGVWELRAGGQSKRFRGTAKEAEKALAAMVATGPKGAASGTTTLADLIAQWQSTRRVEESTAERYDAVLRHLPERVAKVALGKLTLRTFDTLYADLERGGMSAQDIKKLHTALSSALTQGVRWGMLDQHPARGASLPTIQTRRARIPQGDELARLIAAAADDLQGELWLRLAVAAGPRRAEVLALKWSKLNMKTGEMTIDGSITRKGVRKASTKTNVERSLILDGTTLALLSRWKVAQRQRALEVGVGMVRDPYVLSHRPDGATPWMPNSASQRFKRLAIRAGLFEVRPHKRTGVPTKYATVHLHDLRHANASMMLQSGVSAKAASQRLGNSPVVLLRTYAHVLDGEDRAAADAIASRLG